MTIDTIIVDLDDTLFNELDYVYGGFRDVAVEISKINNIEQEDVYNRIIYQFVKYGRKGIFDSVLEYFKINNQDAKGLVNVYREHAPNICLYSDIVDSLSILKSYFKVIIVTDGTHSVQKNKIAALKLDGLVDGTVYCMEHNAPKPSILSLMEALKISKTNIDNALLIGDDPYCDMILAHNANIKSCRVLTGKYRGIKNLKGAEPEAEFLTFFGATKYIMENYTDD